MEGSASSAVPEERTGEEAPAAVAGIHDSLLGEIQGATDAAVAHVRKVAATAAADARLGAVSAAAIAAVAVVALALVLVAWICLLALGVWLAIQAGSPVWAALTGALALNVAGILACRWWLGRLLPNLGFARTRGLLHR